MKSFGEWKKDKDWRRKEDHCLKCGAYLPGKLKDGVCSACAREFSSRGASWKPESDSDNWERREWAAGLSEAAGRDVQSYVHDLGPTLKPEIKRLIGRLVGPSFADPSDKTYGSYLEPLVRAAISRILSDLSGEYENVEG